MQASDSAEAQRFIVKANGKLYVLFEPHVRHYAVLIKHQCSWEGSVVHVVTVTPGEVPDLWDPVTRQIITMKKN